MNLTSLITGPARLGLTIGARVAGLVQSRLGGGQQIDDSTIQHRVEADVFGSRRVTKGKVEIEVNEGVVWVRGEVKSKSVADEVESRARAIDGVQRVENLLRIEKAPSRARPKPQARRSTASKSTGSKGAAPKGAAPKRSARPKPAAATAPPPAAEPVKPATPPPAAQEERPVTRRFNAEKTPPAEAEPTPRELAETGQGRKPAPLGAGAGGSGDSPPAPFPSMSNGSGGSDGPA